MSALKYGSLYAARAAATAMLLDASRLKNQTPGSRPLRCTYVRTFTSWNEEIHGSGGVMTGRTPVIVNGIRPAYAFPSNVSRSSPGGRSACSSDGGTSQCRKRR